MSDGFQKLAEFTDAAKKFHASMDKVRAKMKELDEKEQLRAQVQALSEQNAELREALEEIASWSQDTHLLWWQKRARAALANKGEK